MRAHFKETAVCINDLGFGALLELFAVLVFGEDDDGDTQNDAFAPAAIWSFGHNKFASFRPFYAGKQIWELAFQAGSVRNRLFLVVCRRKKRRFTVFGMIIF